jgi:type III pantothenate kinase
MDRIAINIGNSRTSCGIFRDGKLSDTWDYSTSDMINASAGITECVHSAKDTQLVVCSVVPGATKKLKRCLSELEIDTHQITAQSQNIIHGHYPTIGTDRIASAAGALHQFPKEQICLVFDFGTATTLTAIDKTGKFLGGFISLGLGKIFDSLHRYTAQLPDLKQALGTTVSSAPCHDTESAIISGCVLGHVGLFEKWVSQSRNELGSKAAVIITGGYARYLAPYTKEIDYLEPNLTLIGINLLADEARVLEGRA